MSSTFTASPAAEPANWRLRSLLGTCWLSGSASVSKPTRKHLRRSNRRSRGKPTPAGTLRSSASPCRPGAAKQRLHALLCDFTRLHSLEREPCPHRRLLRRLAPNPAHARCGRLVLDALQVHQNLHRLVYAKLRHIIAP
eukprot:32855-Prorocentrum_minimum.AAC.2